MEIETEINGLLKDVNNIVSKHIKKISLKMKETKKAEEECLEFIKGIPFVKRLIEENNLLKKKLKCINNKDQIRLEIREKILDIDKTEEEIIEDIKSIKLSNDSLNLNDDSEDNNDDPITKQFLNFSGLIYNNEDDVDENSDSQLNDINKNDINPFPIGTSSHLNFNMGIGFSDITKAPSLWASLNITAPSYVRDAYPELDWSITDMFSEQTKSNLSFEEKLFVNEDEDEEDEEDEEEEEVDEEEDDEDEQEDEDEVDEEEDDEDEQEDEDEVDEEEVDEEEVDEDEVDDEEVNEDEQEDEDDEEVDEDEEEVDEDEEEVDEDEEEEVEEIEIDGKDYFTNDPVNGVIYDVDDDGDPGDEVGWFENGTAFFS